MIGNRQLAERIVEALFLNAHGEQADRLVMTAGNKTKRDLGGWSVEGATTTVLGVLGGAALEEEFVRAKPSVDPPFPESQRCPTCGYPDCFHGEHYKGIYEPGKPCPVCDRRA